MTENSIKRMKTRIMGEVSSALVDAIDDIEASEGLTPQEAEDLYCDILRDFRIAVNSAVDNLYLE